MAAACKNPTVRDIRPVEVTERAHLRDERGWTPPVHRYLPPAELAGLVRGFWVPVWDLPPSERTVQRVLQYPVGQLVVSGAYARLVGPTRGLGRQELTGRGWAVGTMLQPAAAALLLAGPATPIVEGWVDLADLPGIDGAALTARVRDLVAEDPERVEGHLAALDAVCAALERLPLDREGELVNELVQLVESDSSVLRVDQLTARASMTERTLQRLVQRRTGLSPKWLIQRRRLHEAAGRLAAGEVDLAGLAAELGYADQAHLTTDFRRVTGVTPGVFVRQRRGSGGGP